jgi:hypothetical protein
MPERREAIEDSGKMRRAVELAKQGTGIQILTESEFFQML